MIDCMALFLITATL